jgi:hypothetical protein
MALEAEDMEAVRYSCNIHNGATIIARQLVPRGFDAFSAIAAERAAT